MGVRFARIHTAAGEAAEHAPTLPPASAERNHKSAVREPSHAASTCMHQEACCRRFMRIRRYSRAQALGLVAFDVAVVMPGSHRVQLGQATVSLPPKLQEPLAQTMQLGPPLPAGPRLSAVAGRAAASSRAAPEPSTQAAGPWLSIHAGPRSPVCTGDSKGGGAGWGRSVVQGGALLYAGRVRCRDCAK